MSDERYFKIEYDEEWYLFDSTTISEQLVKEQAEYGYGVFANSLSPSEVVDLLNEQQATIEQLQKKLSKCQGHKLELTPIPISRPITLKEAEDSIRVTKYEELFDDE